MRYLFVFLLVFITACGWFDAPFDPKFTITQLDELTVTLDASDSSPQNQIVAYDWVFEGGGVDKGVFVKHSFAEAGTYEVTLTVTGRNGEQATQSQKVSLIGANHALSFSDSSRGSFRFVIDNTSDEAVNWFIILSHHPDNPQSGNWLRINPQNGNLLAGAQQEIVLSLLSDLEPGAYLSILSLNYDGGSQSFEVSAFVANEGIGDAQIEGIVKTANAEIEIKQNSSFSASVLDDLDTQKPAYAPGQLLVAYREVPNKSLQSLEAQRSYVAELRSGLQADYGLELMQVRSVGQPDLVSIPKGSSVEVLAERLRRDPQNCLC